MSSLWQSTAKSHQRWINRTNSEPEETVKDQRFSNKFTTLKQFRENKQAMHEILLIAFDDQEEMSKLVLELLPCAWVGKRDLYKFEETSMGEKCFEGEVKVVDGKPHRHGLGISERKNGLYYEGEFKHNTFHGEGRMQWSDGAKFEGTFRENERRGMGKLIQPDGSIYIGMFQHDDFNGKGRIMWKDGQVYEGGWRKGRRQGYGEFYWPDGDYFKGYYIRGEMDGPGEYVFADGTTFQGNYVRGQRHGKGVEIKSDGSIYDGMWDEGYMHGAGKQALPNGSIYVGLFEDGYWEGKGVLTHADDFKQWGYWHWDGLTTHCVANRSEYEKLRYDRIDAVSERDGASQEIKNIRTVVEDSIYIFPHQTNHERLISKSHNVLQAR